MNDCFRKRVVLSSNPKAILYFSSFGNLKWGGQKSLYHLVTRLDRKRYRPVVLLPTDEDFAEVLRQEGVEVAIFQLPAIGFANLFSCFTAVKYLFRLIAAEKIMLLHTDGPRNTLYAGLVSRLRFLPVVFHVRDSDRDRYDRLLYRCADRIVLVADALRERFHWVREGRKFITIYNGVDLSQFPKDRVASPAPARPPFADRILSIVCAGRIEPRKGQNDLIDACQELKERKIPFQLLLAGDVEDDRYIAACRSRASELKIADQVTFAGHIENMPAALQKADIFVLPSIFGEAFSRAIIEAMAAAKPVVATDVGGAKEAIEDCVSGYVVPPADPRALANKILSLALDEPLRRRFGAAARRRVADLFTIETNVRKTEQVYAELLGSTDS